LVRVPNRESLNLPDELLVLGAAVEVGLIQRLKTGNARLTELVEELALDRRALDAVLSFLLSQGYVRQDKDAYSLTDEAYAMFFNEEDPAYTGMGFMHAYTRIGTWLSLPAVLKSGTPPKRERNAQKLGYFMDAMRSYAREVSPRVVALLMHGFAGARLRVVDLGGGPLNYAVPLARAGARVTVVDIPNVLALMADKVPRDVAIELWPGDFNERLPEGPFDIAFLGNVSHIYSGEENRELIIRVGRIVVPGGRIAILDYVRGISPRAGYMAVNMLLSTQAGGTYTLDEYTGWLCEAGFAGPVVHEVSGRQLLIANKL